MFGKKYKREVVPESEYTDFSHRNEEQSNDKANIKTIVAASIVPVSTVIALGGYKYLSSPPSIPPVPVPTTIIEPSVIPTMQEVAPNIIAMSDTPQMIPTGFIADKSLEMLATVLDPLVQIMVAVSFPIASVIMIGGCFFFMLGNSERAWQTIMNAGLGYVLVQLSPLFLAILRQVGDSVAQ